MDVALFASIVAGTWIYNRVCPRPQQAPELLGKAAARVLQLGSSELQRQPQSGTTMRGDRPGGGDDLAFPLIVEPAGPKVDLRALCMWMREHPNELDTLLRRGLAVMFRGFHVDSPQLFSDMVQATGLDELPYVGGAAVRKSLAPRVFTANEAPSSEKIPFHHEMAQVPKSPTHLFFCCETQPTEGGETPLLQSHLVVQYLQERYPEMADRLENEGVRYVRVMPKEDDPTSAIGRGWTSTFHTNDHAATETRLREQEMEWEWLGDEEDCLKTISKPLAAIRADPRDGCKVFYNSMVAAFTGWNDSRNDGRTAVVYANGESIDSDAIRDIARFMDDISVALPWCKGDFYLVDNRTVMHARRPFEPPRRVMASLVFHPAR